MVEYTCTASSSSTLLQWIVGPLGTNAIINRASTGESLVDGLGNTIITVQRVSVKTFSTMIAIATNLTNPETFPISCLDSEAMNSASIDHNPASMFKCMIHIESTTVTS